VTEDKFYVAPRGSFNLLSYPTMQRQGFHIADAVNAFSTEHLSTSNIKADTVASLENSFPGVFKDGFGQCTVTKATLTPKQNATQSTVAPGQCPTPLYRLWSKSLTAF